uniref:Uncharacterized protein n=1 Tax=Tetranychus urticae TaxID=32264 RepID=T1KZ02_TETUR
MTNDQRSTCLTFKLISSYKDF